jgi:hypothetical protein
MSRWLLLFAAGCSVDLGEFPSKCSDGECPEGYDCIHGVCAAPGSEVPITVAQLGNQRGGDIKLVVVGEDVLVGWESYPYAPRGQAVLGKRLRKDGTLSEELVLESTWEGDPGAVEPFFDLYSVDSDTVLVAMSASAVDDDPRPRVRVFRASLGGEAEAVWDREIRMGTIGYGNVSQARFVRTDDGRLELGYFEAKVLEGETTGRLAVFELEANGALTSPLDDCALADDTCCAAHICLVSERTGSLAAGVASVRATAAGAGWFIDETRPSWMRLGGGPTNEVALPALAVPVLTDEDGLLFVEPSPRQGDMLPDDPVAGPAKLYRRDFTSSAKPELVGELPTTRDNPGLAWVNLDSGKALLVTPGAELASPVLKVLSVDTSTAETSVIAEIQRRSSMDIGSVRAVAVGDTLFVVWLDVADDRAVIRASTVTL